MCGKRSVSIKNISIYNDWSRICLLNFNCDKCHVLTLGKLDTIRYTHRYTIYQSELEHVFEEEHISSKVKKANSIMGLIRRSFSFLDCHLFKQLYITFVRPHLEYAQTVWAPHLMKYINIIENV